MRAPHVDKLASDIISGRWVVNGASIVFDTQGTLVDGQHRLAAIAKCGIAVQTTVVRGVPDKAMQTIDSNISRSAHDVVEMHGFMYARRITGAARMIIALADESDRPRKHSNASLFDFVNRNSRLQDAARDTDKVSQIAPASLMIAWFYLAREIGGFAEKSDQALDVLVSGIPSYQGDPIHLFREKIIRMDPNTRNHPVQRQQLLWTLIAAWNDFVVGRKMTICKIRKTPVKMTGVDLATL
jgi:hypothetical protein